MRTPCGRIDPVQSDCLQQNAGASPDRTMSRPICAAAAAVAIALLLAGCAVPGRMAEPAGMGPTEAREAIVRLLPAGTDDRAGWAAHPRPRHTGTDRP